MNDEQLKEGNRLSDAIEDIEFILELFKRECDDGEINTVQNQKCYLVGREFLFGDEDKHEISLLLHKLYKKKLAAAKREFKAL